MASVTLTSPLVTAVDFNKYSNVPHELKALPNWVCHRKKLPFHPSGYAASSTNPNTWTTFEEAVRHEGNFDGIGFMFSGSGYVGIDIDKCRDPQTGVAEEWAREILKSVNSFSELSFNGTGFHIFAKGSKPGPRCKFGRLEIYDSDRYFTVSGIALRGLSSIESRDITWLYDRAVAGEFDQTATKLGQVAGTGSRNDQGISIVRAPGSLVFTDKVTLLSTGDIVSQKPFVISDGRGNSLSYPSQSEADLALMTLLAMTHSGDREKMETAFRASTLYRDKFERDDIREGLLRMAIETFEKSKSLTPETTKPRSLEFAKPPVIADKKTGHLDFVIAPPLGGQDGWFPRGDVSVIGAPSGGGKSTLILDLLDRQKKRQPVFGHGSYGLPFLICMFDRGPKAHQRTMDRLRLNGREKDFPTKFLSPLSEDACEIAQELIRNIESADEIPAVVFVEGGDIASVDPSKSGPTKIFLRYLQEISAYYHVAFILSVGTPKLKVGEEFTTERAHLFGSSFWGRMTETVAIVHEVKDDETGSKRELVVLPRNSPSEKIRLVFEDGRLVQDTSAATGVESPETQWMRSRGANYFTTRDVMMGLDVTRAAARRIVEDALEDGDIIKKPGPRNGRGVGRKEYRWIGNETPEAEPQTRESHVIPWT